MRVTTFFRKILGVAQLVVVSAAVEAGNVALKVRPCWRRARCSECGKVAPGYDRLPERRWRHLAFGRFPVWLRYARRRVKCPHCGVVVEKVPWADADSGFTYDFEEMAAYLAQITDKTKVTEMLGISWRTVGRIVERVVSRRLDASRLGDLHMIGVDEFGYRKRHRYITIVVDHERERVVWAKEGRDSEVLKGFFEELGPEGRERIETVTMDMAKGYIKAVRDSLPQARIVFDRFHVQQLASEAVDEVRRGIVRELRGCENEEEAKAVKGTRFVLLKRPRNLDRAEKEKLSEVQRTNRRLYRAYLLKETLTEALEYQQAARAEEALRNWLGWAARSRLEPFVRTARTIREHFEGVLAYVKTRMTNALAEGINNKLRMVARRAYGFHGAQALISMLFLTCGGVALNPPLP